MKVSDIFIDEKKKEVVVSLQPDVGGLLTYEMLEKLRIKEDLKSEEINHASEQVWWETLLSELRKYRQEFELIEYQQYMAHWRRYAKYILIGRKEKDTIEARQDLISIVFSENTSEESRDMWARLAYKGWLVEQGREDYNEEEFKVFKYRMYLLQENETYESMIRKLLDMKRIEEGLQAIVDGFKQKGIFLSVLAGTEKALVLSSVGRINNSLENDLLQKLNR